MKSVTSIDGAQSARQHNEVLLSMLENPPRSLAELLHIVAPIEASQIQRFAFEQLRKPHSRNVTSMLCDLLRQQPQKAIRDELIQAIFDKDTTHNARTELITLLPPEDFANVVNDPTHEDMEFRQRIASEALTRELIVNASKDGRASRVFVELAMQCPDDVRHDWLLHIESLRQTLEVSPSALYGAALQDSKLSKHHPLMIDALMTETGIQALRLLEWLYQHKKNPGLKHRLMRRMTELRSNVIDPKKAATWAAGSALLSSCDGQGAFVLLMRIKHSRHDFSMLNLCIRAAQDIRDGYVTDDVTSMEYDGLRTRMESEGRMRFVQIPWNHVADVINEGIERTRRLGKSIPKDAQKVIKQLNDLLKMPRTDRSNVELASAISAESVSALLERPEYDSWFFDFDDLGLPLESVGFMASVPTGYQSLLNRLDTVPIRQRLDGMLTHMSLWHALDGDNEAAALCHQLRQQLQGDFGNCELVHAMLRRVIRLDIPTRDDAVYEDDDERFRNLLRAIYFDDLEKPTGADLAKLDCLEVAWVAVMEYISENIPNDRRPRENDLTELIGMLGTEFSQLRIRDLQKRQSADELDEALDVIREKACQLMPAPKDEVLAMTHVAFGAMMEFLEEVCSQCPHQCYSHPERRMDAVFFSPSHPCESPIPSI